MRDWVPALMMTLRNVFRWNSNREFKFWMDNCRLNMNHHQSYFVKAALLAKAIKLHLRTYPKAQKNMSKIVRATFTDVGDDIEEVDIYSRSVETEDTAGVKVRQFETWGAVALSCLVLLAVRLVVPSAFGATWTGVMAALVMFTLLLGVIYPALKYVTRRLVPLVGVTVANTGAARWVASQAEACEGYMRRVQGAVRARIAAPPPAEAGVMGV